jgi:hypothetical protein
MKTLEDVLEEIVPTPDPDFVADMEWRMRQGFPQPARRSPIPRFALPSLRPRALAAVAASAMLGLLVTVSLLDGRSEPSPDDTVAVLPDDAQSTSGGAAAAGAEEVQRYSTQSDSPGAADIAPAPPIPGHEDVAPRARDRQVERSAQLTLAADPDDFDGIGDSIFRIADRRRGFVLRSSFTQGEGGGAGGFFELRVPSAELQPALNELSRLATVRARSESGNDVTASFVSLRDRLRTSLAERKSLLRRLELAFTDTAVQALRQRLATVGRTIAGLRSQLRSTRERTEFATVLITLVDEDTGAAGPGATDEAVDDAVGTLEAVLNFLIRALGVLVPVGLTALLVWGGAALARRRARERALA